MAEVLVLWQMQYFNHSALLNYGLVSIADGTTEAKACGLL
jgi:hypothetical protein